MNVWLLLGLGILGASAVKNKADAAGGLDYSLGSVKLEKKAGTLWQLRFRVELVVRNTSRTALGIDRLEAVAAVNGAKVADTQRTTPVTVPADGEVKIPLSVVVGTFAVGQAVLSALNNPESKTVITVKVWPKGIPAAITITEEYPLPQLLKK